MKKKYYELEKKLAHAIQERTIDLLRWSIGIIYLWYGALKLLGISPAEELIYQATHWIGAHEFLRLLGVWEMIIGLCLFSRKLRRIGLWLLFIHFPGTFLPIFINPEDVFTSIPFGLTLEGQYIFKNLIILAAALVITGSLHRKPPSNE